MGNEFTVPGGSSTPNEMLYRGEQFDSDLGLYYLRARYYNPTTGRFMSRDPGSPSLVDPNGTPTDPKMLHKYLYAGGDPVNAVDPSGRASLLEYAGVNLSVGAQVLIYAGGAACLARDLAGRWFGVKYSYSSKMAETLDDATCAITEILAFLTTPIPGTK